MASLKRPRDGNNWNDLSSLDSFGDDLIVDLQQGNSVFARGAFGELSLALLRSENDGLCFAAVKTIQDAYRFRGGGFGSDSSAEKTLSKEFVHELGALRHLRHDNIVPLLAVFPSRKKHAPTTAVSLVFSHSPVDLYTALEWRRRSFLPLLSFQVIKAVAKDVLSALDHCHSHSVLHRDIKPGNLLISPQGKIQLCDFGLAKAFVPSSSSDDSGDGVTVKEGEPGSRGLCTLHYRPPEVLLGGPASHPAVDMYSAGLVVAQMVTGRVLFSGINVLDQLSLTFDQLGTPTETTWPGYDDLFPDGDGKLTFRFKTPKSWDKTVPRIMECPHLDDFLTTTIRLDPKRRFSATDALRHGLFLDSTNGPCVASETTVAHELIPPALQLPPRLAPTDEASMTQLALSMAQRRRQFLLNQNTLWEGPDAPHPTKLGDLTDHISTDESSPLRD